MDMENAAKLVGYYRYVFGSAEGQEVLKDLGIRCGVTAGDAGLDGLSYQAGPDMTPETRAYRDGQQDFYKAIELLANSK